jgi:hypothetical protein
MTDPRVAALAVDLGLKLASDLVPRRRPGEPIKPLPWSKDGPKPATPAPLVAADPDDLIEYTPTSSDFRKAQKLAGWRAVCFVGPPHALPTIFQGMEQWRLRIGTTASPRDVKRLAELWGLGFDMVLHVLLWCESADAAERLCTMLIDALDYRGRHISRRFYDLPPPECEKLALEVAKTGRIPVFDEPERQQRLQDAVLKLDRAVKLIKDRRR